MRHLRKAISLGIGGVVLFVGGGVAWWLVSPLFISRTVHEEFPLAATAVVPKGMTRSEVERVMAGMARVDQEMDEGMPDALATARAVKSGAFRDADPFHKGSGQATIYRLPDGASSLRLEDFRVTNGPALHVLLARHPDPRSRADLSDPGSIDLGPLKGNIGNQNYSVPTGIDVAAHGSVVIYCKPFHVIFSVASLREER